MKKKHQKHVIRFVRLLYRLIGETIDRKGTLNRTEIGILVKDACDAYGVGERDG